MALLVFILGTIFGSFYLVIATRLPQGKDVLFTRSVCNHCNHTLKWYNLIPLFSFLVQRGKCTFCHKKIASEHFLAELITGLAFLACFLYYGFSYNFFQGIIIISLTIIIFISDFKYLVILDSPLVCAFIFSLILQIIYKSPRIIMYNLISGICLFLVMLLIEKIGTFLFKREALGGGDIKLSFIIGFILGFKLGLLAVILSTFLALPYSIASLYLIKNKEVAYGPFLAGAMLIIFLTLDKWHTVFNFLFLL